MRTGSSPLVSVVVPTYNRLKYLRPAIESVFAQSFDDWELIVADDGSDAETQAFLSTIDCPPRTRVLRQAHCGNPGAVRNAGWRAALGEFIAFLDSDDVWLPQKLTAQVQSLRAHPARGWSHCAFELIDASGQPLRATRPRPAAVAEGWVLERLIRMEATIATPSVLVARDLLDQVGGFDTRQRMCEDYDLWLRLAPLSELDAVLEPLLYVRRHAEHSGDDATAFEDRDRALEKLLAAGNLESMRSLLRRERAKVAGGLARSHSMYGTRAQTLRTLLQSSSYSWGYREWWSMGLEAMLRALAPIRVRRLARRLTAIGGRQ